MNRRDFFKFIARSTAALAALPLVRWSETAAQKNFIDNPNFEKDGLMRNLRGGGWKPIPMSVMFAVAELDEELRGMGITGGAQAATEIEKVQARLNLALSGKITPF